MALPAVLVAPLREHLDERVKSGADAVVFTGPRGASLRRGSFRKSANWSEARDKAGLPAHFRFHDLRHTGNTLAAAAGASTRELMHRMGRASMRAALIYQHATATRDQEIAAAMDWMPGSPAARESVKAKDTAKKATARKRRAKKAAPTRQAKRMPEIEQGDEDDGLAGAGVRAS